VNGRKGVRRNTAARKRRGGSVAVYPGSFDPVTNGHLDIITRGLAVFDEVIIAILVNPQKHPLFTVEERVALIREAYKGEARVRVDTFSGLLVDYAERVGASVIVRGLRAVSDFEFEFQLATMNRQLGREVETLFLTPDEHFTFISSSLVRQIAQLGGDVSKFVHPIVEAELKRKLAAKK
jgi:pantetheine-phosphate adenylyltransferase